MAYYQTNVIAPALAGLTAGTTAYSAAETEAHAQVLVHLSASPEFLSDVQVTAAHPVAAQNWLILVSSQSFRPNPASPFIFIPFMMSFLSIERGR